MRLIRIGVVREEAEEQIAFFVGQVPDFQLLHLGPDRLRVRQQHGHNDQRSKGVRNARNLEIHLRQGSGWKQPRDQVIQNLERELADGDQQKEGDHQPDPGRLSAQTEQDDQGDGTAAKEAEPKKVHCRMMAVYPLQDAET